MNRLAGVSLVLALALGACSQSHTLSVPPVLPGESVSELVGPSGATFALGGVEIEIPAGALAADTMITVTATDAAPPSWATALSPVLRFEPEGLSFAEPIEVRIPFAGDASTASIFWSARDGDAYVARTTRFEGNVAITSSAHFSQAFVGTACAGEDCCGRANGLLDLVLLVDNSNSMTEEQAALEAQIPRFARALATGDLDDDGVQDFPALESVRVGVVTTDMGTGDGLVPTCNHGTFGTGFGDDGVLLTRGRSDLAGCAATYPAFAELGADSPPAARDAFIDQVRCVATVGTGGCGFEQPLESVLKATTASTSGVWFSGSTVGHADGANAGFLRDNSVLAFVMLTDEDDCSAANTDLFNPSSATYGGADLNLRCFTFPDAVHPTARYVEGLLALRADPADLIYAAITGAPPEAIASSPDLESLLESDAMIERIDPSMPTRLAPSCDVPGQGIAFPPRRVVTVARDLDAAGANTVVGSICQNDFTPVLDAILGRVAARARGECR